MKKRGGVAALLLAASMMMSGTTLMAEPVSNSVEDSQVTATLSTDRKDYLAGEEVNFTLNLDNQREYWNATIVALEYRLPNGFSSAGDELPEKTSAIQTGKSVEVTGKLVGSAEEYPASGNPAEVIEERTKEANGELETKAPENAETKAAETTEASGETTKKDDQGMLKIVIAVFVVLAVILVIVVGIVAVKGTRSGKKHSFLIPWLIGALAAGSLLAPATESLQAAVTVDTVTLRPYVKLTYAGKEVTVRMIVTLTMAPQRVTIPSASRFSAKQTSCHDPSIFKDKDGTYYIFGTHMGLSKSTDLVNWTNLDNQFRASFTDETKEAIRAWNKDSGSWYGYLWAPDVIYNETMGKYCMYLSANGDDWVSNIVLLTADTVTGPYSYAGSVVYGGFTAATYANTDAPKVLGEAAIPQRYVTYGVANRKWGNMFPNCIDPCVFYDDDGILWMAYGSWSGGIFMLKLDPATGLRDYSVTYPTEKHSDAYFGKLIAGGSYASGEGCYIEKIGDYYWLFISYGGLNATSTDAQGNGYNVRVYRSKTPDGGYVDEAGHDAYYDKWVQNFNDVQGIRLFGGYRWRTMTIGQISQGHNSAFIDDDGRAFMIFHTRTTSGNEGHYVKVHQLFLNEDGWLVAAPYQTNGEALDPDGVTMEEVAGDYEYILHQLTIDYTQQQVNLPNALHLNADGTLTGGMTGTWSIEKGTSNITLAVAGETYKGVALKMKVEDTTIETMVFTALGEKNQLTLWGSKTIG